MSEATSETAFEAVGGQRSGNARAWIARRAEGIVLPLAALFAGMAAFSIFLIVIGKSPLELFDLMWRGGFSSWFSIQTTLSRTAPLLLAGLCVALPARLRPPPVRGGGATRPRGGAPPGP